MKNIGIIGGSGVYQIDGIELKEKIQVQTPFGEPSAPIALLTYQGNDFYFLPRHGKNHHLLPSEINYQANIFALKKLGVEYLVSFSAVGSLKEELPPTTFFLPDQFIDWTKGKRARSFFGQGIVGHVSVAYPVDKTLQNICYESCVEADVACAKDGSYICIEGPQFSSRAESEIYRGFGASVIGMTNVPEVFLAKEAGIAYSTVAMVTDYDCWKEHHCTVDEIMKVAAQNTSKAKEVMKILIPKLVSNKFDFEKENKFGVLTPRELMTGDQKELVDLLLK
ncbi:S-methyl-5'-thioadenosine phosphorylase [Bacteriovoracaceae bacterium]|nr:S-methyl-5'-thioadenosine phosphorylase [Bacteriovoracaceae bacterium]